MVEPLKSISCESMCSNILNANDSILLSASEKVLRGMIYCP